MILFWRSIATHPPATPILQEPAFVITVNSTLTHLVGQQVQQLISDREIPIV